MKAEEYLMDHTPPPIDEDEIREALAATLKKRAPPALIRLVGRQAYSGWAGLCLMCGPYDCILAATLAYPGWAGCCLIPCWQQPLAYNGSCLMGAS
jgi:hypothetical protein